MSRRDLALEQKVVREFRKLKARPRRVLLALSGGADSMVMAEILWKWARALKLELSVAHVHHGRSANENQNEYRARALKLARKWARERGLDFYTNRARPRLKSEAEYREFREAQLALWREKSSAEAVAFAHHRDDLLETKLIRLIRGSGNQGLEAMVSLRRAKLRPLLTVSQAEIREYALLRGLEWCEDPSNENADILRNWLRREWLPSLEKRRPGAVGSLARSLNTVSAPAKEFDLAPYVGLRRDLFVTGPVRASRRREVLAQYLKALGLKGYAQTHVDEILKRVSSRRKNLAFDMLGLRFQISSEFLWASRV